MIGEILDAKRRIDKRSAQLEWVMYAWQTRLGTTRVVAVTVIDPRWTTQRHLLAGFQREAQACGRLRRELSGKPAQIPVTLFL